MNTDEGSGAPAESAAPATESPPPQRGAGDRTLRLIIAGLILFLLVGVIASVIESGQGGSVPTNTQAPEFTLEKYGGGEVSLVGLRGKVVMLDFWATWCPPCVEELPSLVKLAKEYEGRGLVFLAANRDDPPNHKRQVGSFVERRAPDLAPYVVFASDAMTRDYGVVALPTIFFIDAEGRVVDSQRGALSESQLRKRIERALGAR